jgi:SAM-dependent methyltransferase
MMRQLRTMVARLVRGMRARRARWSPESDRDFHDSIFAAQGADPFDAAYPGNVTIRRFADLAGEHLRDVGEAVDLGCGPGEITCELAARFPAVRFTGWDHSQAAIDRAEAHRAARGLTNVRFERVDVRNARVPASAGLAMLFDAFHHLPDPEAFVAQNAHVPRWFLIEPAGDLLGRWRYRHDLDWLLADLDKVRWHLEYALGMPGPTAAGPAPSADPEGAVEFRYSLDEYARLFSAYGLSVRGTTAGLMAYPPGAGTSDLRRRINDFAYQLFVDADDRLREKDADLDCRHWAIYCERGATFPVRQRRTLANVGGAVPQPTGPYGIRYCDVRVPREIPPRGVVNVTLTVANSGFLDWTAGAGEFHLSYRWLTPAGVRASGEGRRTPLAGPVVPGQSLETNLVVEAPAEPGAYRLEIDAVHEGVTWFSEAGQPTHCVEVRVR